jgi:diguanylate cyclase (GGDEF)-like protein
MDLERTDHHRLLMRQAASLLATDLSLGELFERLTTMLPAYLDSSVVFIALARENAAHTIEYFYDHGEIRRYPHIPLTERSRARAVMTTGEIIWGNHPDVWAPGGRTPINRDRPWTNDTLSAIFVPMRAGGTMIGCLSVQSVHEDAYTQDDVETLAAIGHYLGVAVQNQRMYQALQRTADYDPLTGLSNHSRILRDIDADVGNGADRSLVTVMLDVINFARFNETHGYLAGDDVLRQVAGVLRTFEDAHDGVQAGRFDADVFVVLMRDRSPEETPLMLAQLRALLGDLAYVASDQTLPIAIACGYAEAPAEAHDRTGLIALCEDRTRRSRKAGGVAIGGKGGDGYVMYGRFDGIMPIVETLLDRDPFTRVHLLHANALANAWSAHLPLDGAQRETFMRASLLHDVGKLLVADRLLNKPARLSLDEFESVMLHAGFGRDILVRHQGYEEVAQIVGEHHERWDGGGYPRGLRGEEIHPLARAVAIVDSYSAMVADRPYHRGVTRIAAMAELQRCSGTQFDPGLVERFVACSEEGNLPPLA